MKKLVLFTGLLLVSAAAWCQVPNRVQLVSSQKIIGMPDVDLLKVIRPVFSQDNSTLSADSANFNQAQNTFDAFGNVVITQTDGTVVYSDLLNYNGNTKIAVLTKRVRLVDGDATLSTELMTYNMGTRVGTYTGGGKIVNGKNVLTSKNGYYFAASRDAYFRHDVVVTTPETLIKSDTLRYNSGSKIAYFYGPTHIYGKDDTLYTENGDYNTLYDQARFGKNNLYTQGSKSLTGDSLFYDKKKGYGRAVNNITFTDTFQKITLKGNLGLYRKVDESTLVTQNAYIILTTESDSAKVDSIWMTADTLYSKVVFKKDLDLLNVLEPKNDLEIMAEKGNSASRNGEEGEEAKPLRPAAGLPQAKASAKANKKTEAAKAKETTAKTLPAKTDSTNIDTARTRIVSAYHHARIFKSDLQAKADSLFFSYGDSVMRCYRSPMIWTQGSQLSADTVYLQLKDKKLQKMLLVQKGFIVNTEGDSTKFNQVKGKMMTGYFKNNRLDRLFADGNAESIYYVKEDTSYSGMNRSVSSRIKLLFGDNELKDILFIKKPEMVYSPIDRVVKDKEILEGFIWKPKDRPVSKESIIPSLAKVKTVIKKTETKKPATAPPKKTLDKKPKKK
ncbi:MAG: OstA-like protein [Sphingobacteriaceae bacterium]